MGFLVEALRARDVEAWGVDISEYAVEHVHPAVAEFCWVGSVTDEFPRSYDLIVCIEVLEHLEPSDAEAAIDNICRHADQCLFSSTPLDYQEPTHVNVRQPDYWTALFAEHGFVRELDFDLSEAIAQARLYERSTAPLSRVVAAYERKLWEVEHAGHEMRTALRAQRNTLSQQEERLRELEARHTTIEEALHVAAARHSEELEARTAEFEARIVELTRELTEARTGLIQATTELDALRNTKLFRYARPARAVYTRLRRRPGRP
jgi:2-polyprenyl-3-methyl-5-hydroxy-6-metoxy-1,4-benzoquinol methylase